MNERMRAGVVESAYRVVTDRMIEEVWIYKSMGVGTSARINDELYCILRTLFFAWRHVFMGGCSGEDYRRFKKLVLGGDVCPEEEISIYCTCEDHE